jgi:hypothetical protein
VKDVFVIETVLVVVGVRTVLDVVGVRTVT